jgi:hypothetical protein
MKTIEVNAFQPRVNKNVVEDFGTMVQKFYAVEVDSQYTQVFDADDINVDEFGDYYKVVAEVDVNRPVIMAGDYQNDILPDLIQIVEKALYEEGIKTIGNKHFGYIKGEDVKDIKDLEKYIYQIEDYYPLDVTEICKRIGLRVPICNDAYQDVVCVDKDDNAYYLGECGKFSVIPDFERDYKENILGWE